MQITSLTITALGVLVALYGTMRSSAPNGWRDRQAVRVERSLNHSAVPGLRPEARKALSDEACNATLWLLAQRRYPQRASLTAPLITLVFLAPACLAASYPVGMTGARLAGGSVLWVVYLSVGVWLLSRIARSDTDTATWKLYQLTRGAEIERLLPPPLLGGLLALLFPAWKKRTPGYVRILVDAFAIQHPNDEARPSSPQATDVVSWERAAREIDPHCINAAITRANQR